MKNTAPSLRKPFDATMSSPDFRAPIAVLPELSFPSPAQILAHPVNPHPLLQLTEASPPSRPASLFEGLLGGRVEVLVQDAVDHPERYDEPTRAALQALGARGAGALSPAEQSVLNQATMDFAAYRPPPTPKNAPKPLAPVKKPRLIEAADELTDGRAPQVETPGGTMTPYWWLT
jgi:hypothetical protein